MSANQGGDHGGASGGNPAGNNSSDHLGGNPNPPERSPHAAGDQRNAELIRRGASRAARTQALAADRSLAHVDRLSTLVHELDGLLEGSLRTATIVRRALASAGLPPTDPTVAAFRQLNQQIDAAADALERIASLVHASLQGPQLTLGSPLLSGTAPVTLGDAIHHAADVIGEAFPGVRIHVATEPAAANMPAGPLYTAVLHALKHAAQSIHSAGGIGLVTLSARMDLRSDANPSRPGFVSIRVTDDGVGMTTGSGDAQIGLAMAKSVVERLGGTCRVDAARGEHPARPGSVLEIRVPELVVPQDFIGNDI
ncbi:MAG: hypothetical protein SFY96_11765 [Planctomycetota bacterium]|nr:hypothetical protein [Planctomycetota bacterium]